MFLTLPLVHCICLSCERKQFYSVSWTCVKEVLITLRRHPRLKQFAQWRIWMSWFPNLVVVGMKRIFCCVKQVHGKDEAQRLHGNWGEQWKNVYTFYRHNEHTQKGKHVDTRAFISSQLGLHHWPKLCDSKVLKFIARVRDASKI